MSTPRHRWIVFGAMTGVYFSFGIAVTAIAPMLTAVRDDLGVSRGAMGFALGAWALIYIVTAPLAGRFIDRIGLGWSLALGGLSVSGSLVLRAAAQGLGSLWLAIAFFGVFGPLVSASAPYLMATWFPDENERRAVSAGTRSLRRSAARSPRRHEPRAARVVRLVAAGAGLRGNDRCDSDGGLDRRLEPRRTTNHDKGRVGCGRVGQPILPVSPGLVGDPVDPVRRLRPVLPEPRNQQLDADDPGGVQRYESEHRRRMAGGRRTRLDRRRRHHSRLRHAGTHASADGGALRCGGPRDGGTVARPDLTSRTHRRDRWRAVPWSRLRSSPSSLPTGSA